MKVTMTVGCPGAGKTTWASSLDRRSTIVLCLDDFRACLFGNRQFFWDEVAFTQSWARQYVWRCYCAALLEAVADKLADVVLCNTAIQQWERDLRILSRYGIRPVLRIFDVPLPTLLERNKTRPVCECMDEEYIKRAYSEFTADDAWWRDPQFVKEYHYGE